MVKKLKEKDTVIIIPAFNEEASIVFVLKNLPRERLLEVIVVNNQSTDQTKKKALAYGALVIDEPQQGYGKACLKGIEKAYQYKPVNIAFIDADFSDNPSELELLLEELDKGYDLVIGSRTRGKAQPGSLLPQAIFGNWLATSLMRLFFGGHAFTDLGPFRIIKTKSLKTLKMVDKDFGWTVEMQAKALIQGLKCSEISVSYKQRIGVSKITGTLEGTLKAGYKILMTLFILWLKSKFSTDSSAASKSKS